MEEAQEEERDVLRSIYDGDENFKEINPCCFQYKYGNEATENKAFLLEISWPKEYPSELPTINLDTFFNKCLPSCLKDEIKSKLLVQAEELRDSPMTYSLIDWLNENSEEFISKIPDDIPIKETSQNDILDEEKQSSAQPKEKKENLTKAQKRRITERTNFKGERERGWNWVDIVKHLNQTGNQ